jgi:hypothetical protein
MNLPKLLRIFIVAELLFLIAGIVSDWILQSTLPVELQAYINDSDAAPISNMEIGFLLLLVPVLILFIVSWVGLWRLLRWARLLYTIAWGMSLPLVVPVGPYIMTGLGYTFETTSTLFGGVILGLTYFSDLRHSFEGPRAISHAG